jgi:hypothetical protein
MKCFGRVVEKNKRRNVMKNILNFRIMLKGICLGLLVIGMFTVSFGQPTKKFYAKFDKNRKLFKSPTLDLPGGKIVVSGEVKGIDVSGGNDGCYTLTVSTYRLAPNGEKILVRSRSKRVCVDITNLPDLVIDRIPRGTYIVEVGIDLPRDFGEGKFEAEINVTYPSEIIRP